MVLLLALGVVTILSLASWRSAVGTRLAVEIKFGRCTQTSCPG